MLVEDIGNGVLILILVLAIMCGIGSIGISVKLPYLYYIL